MEKAGIVFHSVTEVLKPDLSPYPKLGESLICFRQTLKQQSSVLSFEGCSHSLQSVTYCLFLMNHLQLFYLRCLQLYVWTLLPTSMCAFVAIKLKCSSRVRKKKSSNLKGVLIVFCTRMVSSSIFHADQVSVSTSFFGILPNDSSANVTLYSQETNKTSTTQCYHPAETLWSFSVCVDSQLSSLLSHQREPLKFCWRTARSLTAQVWHLWIQSLRKCDERTRVIRCKNCLKLKLKHAGGRWSDIGKIKEENEESVDVLDEMRMK